MLVIGFLFITIFYLGIFVLVIAGMWKFFEKAGKPGWAAIIPIYNQIVLAEIGGKPSWWGVLCLIPLAGIVFAIWILNVAIKSFGKDEGFTIGTIFLPFVFWPILGFSKDIQYRGPYSNTAADANYMNQQVNRMEPYKPKGNSDIPSSPDAPKN
jgi:hypothetical protein